MEISKTSEQSSIQSVVQVLAKDLPTLFVRDISYDIYSQDIFFKDPVNQFKGKFNYRIIFWTLRFHARLFFKEIYFDVHEIQPQNNDKIRVDWTVRGTLRVPWQTQIYFDGYSIYSLNEKGLIDDHRDTWDRSPQEILKQFLPKSVNREKSS